MNEADLIKYLELLGTQIRMLEGRIDVTLAVLRQLVPHHPNAGVLEMSVRQWLESPQLAALRHPQSPADLRARRGSAEGAMGLLFGRAGPDST